MWRVSESIVNHNMKQTFVGSSLSGLTQLVHNNTETRDDQSELTHANVYFNRAYNAIVAGNFFSDLFRNITNDDAAMTVNLNDPQSVNAAVDTVNCAKGEAKREHTKKICDLMLMFLQATNDVARRAAIDSNAGLGVAMYAAAAGCPKPLTCYEFDTRPTVQFIHTSAMIEIQEIKMSSSKCNRAKLRLMDRARILSLMLIVCNPHVSHISVNMEVIFHHRRQGDAVTAQFDQHNFEHSIHDMVSKCTNRDVRVVACYSEHRIIL